ncbi:MAG TPA: hypothetical protein VK215_15130 [Acidimicrobiales bacterium]|nr:hypothetical protein [Acidimicrobiales bacterium]HLN43789.1 hypothetical protein [Acidimicrobiales bacterium]
MPPNKVEPQSAAPPALREGPLVLSDVYLLTAESQGSTAVPGLTVQLDESGLTVRKPDGTTGAFLAWTEVSGLVADRRIRTPAGSQGVVLEAVTTTRTHRFVVPSDNPEGLRHEIRQLSGTMVVPSTKAGPGDRRRSGVLVGALVVVIVAAIALAVLVATGTVKF